MTPMAPAGGCIAAFRRTGVAGLAAALLSASTMLSSGAESAGTLVTETGEHPIVVEVAETPEARETGLMNRDFMPADQGMLFDFEADRPVTMWMKNTYIPLDMLFMDSSGEVTRVARNAQPLSLSLINSGGPVRYVLELNGGAAARYGVKPGDRLIHPMIGATAQ